MKFLFWIGIGGSALFMLCEIGFTVYRLRIPPPPKAPIPTTWLTSNLRDGQTVLFACDVDWHIVAGGKNCRVVWAAYPPSANGLVPIVFFSPI